MFSFGAQGFEVRESSNFLIRCIEWLMGRTGNVKLRLGLFEGGPPTHRIGSLEEVVLKKRRLVGPEAKSVALRRSWEVRVRGAGSDGASIFFRFRDKAEAKIFARILRREIEGLRNAPHSW